jgi:hypothetical protein
MELEPSDYGYATRDGCTTHLAHSERAPARPNSEIRPPDLFDVYLWVDDVEACTRSSPDAAPTSCTHRRIGPGACARFAFAT